MAGFKDVNSGKQTYAQAKRAYTQVSNRTHAYIQKPKRKRVRKQKP